jgi:predicted HAD superfamily Cof-like phosphohydrolase
MKGFDFFDLQGHKIGTVLQRLGQPTRVDPMPIGPNETQYRFDFLDEEYVVFIFECAGRVARVSLVKKAEWPGWSGHQAKTGEGR